VALGNHALNKLDNIGARYRCRGPFAPYRQNVFVQIPLIALVAALVPSRVLLEISLGQRRE
jgi:hypothetical protein